jgi:hypothetical protein
MEGMRVSLKFLLEDVTVKKSRIKHSTYLTPPTNCEPRARAGHISYISGLRMAKKTVPSLPILSCPCRGI